MILEKSRKGQLTARINNRYIHSRYDPEKEARQLLYNFISQENYDTDKTIVVFEPGLGYILKELKKKHSDSRIITLFFSTDCYRFCESRDLLINISSYHPESTISFDEYLDKTVSCLDIRNLLFLEIPSTTALFKDLRNHYQKKILENLSISHGSEMTKNHFALRWILNSFSNFIHQDFSGQITSIDSPVILTASGPSLEKHISEIKKYSKQYIIAALPSSLAILKSNGIVPDILFTTDPGYYAREHLRYLSDDSIIVSSVISSLVRTGNICCGINQKSFAETMLLKDSELSYFPEMGTVAATALFYLMKHTTKNIYISGLDFCMDDIKMHAQPHSFTALILKNESRLEPSYSSFYTRAASMTHEVKGHLRLTKNMNTYTAWFKKQDFGERVFRLTPAPVDLPISELENLPPLPMSEKKMEISRNSDYPSYTERCNRLKNLGINLESMMSDYENNKTLSPSLSDFVQNVLPMIRLNKNKNRLEKDSSSDDFLYKMKYLIRKIGCISNG